MSAERNFTEQDYELLSAYLDGALAPDELARLETRLQTDDGLRQELESLRQTVKMVGSLPAMKSPRNFTLTRDMVRLRQNRWLIFPTSAAFSGVTAAAATILILIGAGLFFLQNTASNTAAPSIMQSAGMEQQDQTELAFFPTQTAFMSEKTAETAEQEAADQIQIPASVTAPPMTSLMVTQVLLTAETITDGSMGSGGDAFASSPDTMDMQIAASPAAGEISGYTLESATAEEQATEILTFAVPMAATFSPQATLASPAQPPAAVDSAAAQVGGNSEPDDSTQTGIAESGLSDQANAVISTPSATFGRESQEAITASAPANSAIIAAANTATALPTASPSPSATVSQTLMPTQPPPATPFERRAEPTVISPADFAPVIVLIGLVLLTIAVITTFIRRRG
jgi:anti-sigma factor RsiW